ncbi:Dyp-type peroxidase [Vibrio penaeicida]|uniref:Peroxidase n=1 Tax=Vibrio penaeicida TaxID=104609 RepID=A0AAV5NYM6_9VIBR|nr:Dyp-type peroxidase [Vibrio penaeicida]RTZ20295.1 Dyp-type peroxidase [Vibrio penaeicida]GLQ75413.1 peroxidase [Vibrio penaeicida]
MSDTPSPAAIDLHDIQGNIIKGYGRFGYPHARYLFLSVRKEADARRFLRQIINNVTTSVPWGQPGPNQEPVPKPLATTNVGFTYNGLKAIGVPQQSLQSFPQAFAMGMPARKDILGDDLSSAPEHWDPIWHSPEKVHLWLSINGQTQADIEIRYKELLRLIEICDAGVELLQGHRAGNGELLPYQDAAALRENEKVTPKEHFGYVDGISDPFFKGTGAPAERVLGAGKPTGKDPSKMEGWEPLETGEFILGHRDESFEYPKAPTPPLLAKNGTFMVYRKLHQNVKSFKRYSEEVGKDFEGGSEALSAKFVGRWKNGAPIASFPTQKEADAFHDKLRKAQKNAKENPTTANKEKYLELKQQLTAFNYSDDIKGSACPMGSHVRRANPRGALEYGVKDAFNTPGALVNRRRILRRGLPYGTVSESPEDSGNQGIIFMALNADIERQFEFVQQQWMNYGNDFKRSNEKDPIIGNMSNNPDVSADGSMLIQGNEQTGKKPFFCSHIPRFVETRGGDYFFIPSLTALRMLAEGIIDPT